MTDSRNMSLSPLALTPTPFTSRSFLFSLQQFLFCQSCLLLITLFTPSLSPLVRKVQKSLKCSASVLQDFVSQSEGESFPVNSLHGPLLPRVLFKAMCFITVVVRPNDTSNEQQIHTCKTSIFSSSFCFFLLL